MHLTQILSSIYSGHWTAHNFVMLLPQWKSFYKSLPDLLLNLIKRPPPPLIETLLVFSCQQLGLDKNLYEKWRKARKPEKDLEINVVHFLEYHSPHTNYTERLKEIFHLKQLLLSYPQPQNMTNTLFAQYIIYVDTGYSCI